MEDDKQSTSSAIGQGARWFNYRRQEIPRLIDEYCATRITLTFEDESKENQPGVLQISSSDLNANAMQWWNIGSIDGGQIFDISPARLGITQNGTNFQSRLFQTFGEFRVRCMKITLVPLNIGPHVNAARLESFVLYPSNPVSRSDGTPYDPSSVVEYPKYSDVLDADDYMQHAASANDRVIQVGFVPQVRAEVFEPQLPNSWSVVPMPWCNTSTISQAYGLLAPWIGWRKPYAPNPVVVATYQIVLQAIVEFRNPDNSV